MARMAAVLRRYPRRMNHVVWKVIDGKGILLNLETGAYFEVGPVGLEMWQRCDGRTLAEHITPQVARQFRAEPERVARDLQQFLGELRRRKLIELCATPARAARN